MHRFLILLFLLVSQLSAEEKEEHLILVTGCARSGTRYTALVLRDCGLDVGHEWVFSHGLTSWLMAADCDECPWGASPSNKYRFKHIFHQVRHPLKVIASVYLNEPPVSWEFIYRHVPQIKHTDSHLVKCAKYWYYWNLKAEKKAEYTYRVEDIQHALGVISERMDYAMLPNDLAAISKETNTRDTPPEFTWDDLQKDLPCQLFYDIQMMALKYGYTID